MSHSEATGERGLVGALRDESRVLEGARPGHYCGLRGHAPHVGAVSRWRTLSRAQRRAAA